MGQVDVIVTDCPILLSPVYDKEKRSTLEQLVVDEHNKMWSVNFFIHRVKPYNANGRLKDHSDEKKAIELDVQITSILNKHNILFDIVDGNDEGKNKILIKVLNLINYEKFNV